MRGWWVLTAVAAMAIAGCGQAANRTTGSGASAQTEAAVAPSPASAPADAAARGRGGSAPPPVSQVAPGAPIVGLPLLAFSYRYTLEAPNDRLPALMRRHEQACAAAGPAVCQVTDASLNTDRSDETTRGVLTLRAQPQWLAAFRNGLDAEARGAGGRVLGAATSTEDLTRSIVDTEAYLRAKTTLRDRLQQLLATRSGPLADLIEVERQLAQVQGEIDAGQSQLQVMRTRVATSALTLTYQSASVAVTGGTWEPLRGAADNFVDIIVWALAAMVTIVAFLIPFAVVGLPILWLILRSRRKARERRALERTSGPIPPDAAARPGSSPVGR